MTNYQKTINGNIEMTVFEGTHFQALTKKNVNFTGGRGVVRGGKFMPGWGGEEKGIALWGGGGKSGKRGKKLQRGRKVMKVL